MAKRSYTIRLGVSRERALAACRLAISQLGWDLLEPPPGVQLSVREDIRGLELGDSPARIDLELRPGPAGDTDIVMAGSVPGPKWVGVDHLRTRMLALGRLIVAAAA